jgi:pyruvate kinase
MRRTKIVATIGPASSSVATIRDLIAAGVDVFRLNFSHGTRETHAQAIALIRRCAAEAAHTVGILQDLSGPKIRTGRLDGGRPLQLATGDTLRIGFGDAIGGSGMISTTYRGLAGAVKAGDSLLLDDGHIQLRVERNDGRELVTTVVDGGVLGEHKGINAPGVPLPASGLTEKDAADLRFGVSAGVDMVAMSFVQSVADVGQLKTALEEMGAPDVPVIAKIERPEAVEHLEDILRACDAAMVARGDLGLEIPLERVPRIQKEATRLARRLGVPVIIATQVLESMRVEPRPTRAEVSDAANAVHDRVDAIMLAGETAAGAHPVRAVRTLDRVIRDAESLPEDRTTTLEASRLLEGHETAICEAAVTLAQVGKASAIVAITRRGKTARVLAALRPAVPVFAATDRPEIARRLALAWGVVPVVADLGGDVDTAAARIGDDLVARGVVSRGSVIVLVSVNPALERGPSNFVKMLQM